MLIAFNITNFKTYCDFNEKINYKLKLFLFHFPQIMVFNITVRVQNNNYKAIL